MRLVKSRVLSDAKKSTVIYVVTYIISNIIKSMVMQATFEV